jgi:formylglycine-generating enzyme required for sulfatase activity
MVAVPALDGRSYCIDATEVTNNSYAAFLAANPGDEVRSPDCVKLAMLLPNAPDLPSFLPHGAWPPADGTEKLPVVGVTWCDAFSFCEANDKHLCGKVGGAPLTDPWTVELTPDAYTDATDNEWFNACSEGGKRQYAYGNDYDPSRCSAVDPTDPHLTAVGETSCEGGYPGLFDMTGGVYEYVNDCAFEGTTSMSPEQPTCATVGGANAGVTPHDVAATCGETGAESVIYPSGVIGIRCCAETVTP